MRTVTAWGLVLAFTLMALPLSAEEGQGQADASATIDQLGLGTYWYGAPVDKKALLGKVVLVEIWGS